MSTVTPKLGSIVSGRYELLRLLGSGGMGAVFEARNTLTGKHVALKWMHPELAANPSAAQRFIREAQACSRVRHPNVIDVYDVLQVDDSLCLVMELLEGEPLSALMQRERTSLPELVSALLGAMRGVAAAHRAGIVHRDIKPDNIFLAREGDDRHVVPKVLDFGISKVSGTGEMSLTRAGAAMGTPLYMSIEQLSGVKDIDARTDVYAFGVILYQAVTGQPPFDAESFPVLIAKIMTEEAVPPKDVRPDVPTTLSRLIEWAMAKDRDQRIANMEALIAELEPFATEVGFRQQMTLRASELPAISTPGSRPAARVAPVAPKIAAHDRPLEAGVTSTPQTTEIAEIEIRSPRKKKQLVLVGAALALLLFAAWLWSSAPSEEPALHVASPAPPPPSAPVTAPVAPMAPVAPSAAPTEPAATARAVSAEPQVTPEPVTQRAEPSTKPAREPSTVAEPAPSAAAKRKTQRATRQKAEPPPQLTIKESPPKQPEPKKPEPAASTREASPPAGRVGTMQRADF